MQGPFHEVHHTDLASHSTMDISAGQVDRDAFKSIDVILLLTAVARLPERILYAGEVWSASEDFHGCFSFIVISPDGQKRRHSHIFARSIQS